MRVNFSVRLNSALINSPLGDPIQLSQQLAQVGFVALSFTYLRSGCCVQYGGEACPLMSCRVRWICHARRQNALSSTCTVNIVAHRVFAKHCCSLKNLLEENLIIMPRGMLIFSMLQPCEYCLYLFYLYIFSLRPASIQVISFFITWCFSKPLYLLIYLFHEKTLISLITTPFYHLLYTFSTQLYIISGYVFYLVLYSFYWLSGRG